MAVDMFLKIDGIEGESTDSKHKNEIDVQSWSWGATQLATGHTGGGSGTGRASFQDVSFTKTMDKSSPALLQHLSNGKHIPKATLVCRKAGENPLEYLKMTLEDIIVTSYQTSGAAGGGEILMENITLNFARYKFEYTLQDAKGKSSGSVNAGWDIKKNEKYAA